jgi:hypothetical protein
MSSSATSSCNKRKRGERGDDVVDLSADVPVETFEDAPDPIHIYNSASLQVNDAVRNIQREYNGARDEKKRTIRNLLVEVNNIVEAQYQMRRALRQIDRFAVPNEDLGKCLEAVKQMKLVARRELRGTLPGDEEMERAILPFIDERRKRERDENEKRDGN